jgi:hypothetical protein
MGIGLRRYDPKIEGGTLLTIAAGTPLGTTYWLVSIDADLAAKNTRRRRTSASPSTVTSPLPGDGLPGIEQA